MQINIKYENLSDGEYYVKLDNGEIETALYCNGTTRSGFLYLGDRYVVEVLSPVPPYIEWQTLIDSYRSSIITVGALNADNDKLREKIRRQSKEIKDRLDINRRLRGDLKICNAMCEAKHLYTKQLKELLKECREEIDRAKSILTEDTSIDNTVVAHAVLRKLLTKIDNAIGENNGN